MFYADVLGILGISSTLIGKIDTLPEVLVFIVCIIWLTARAILYCAKVYDYLVMSAILRRKARFEQKQREGLNGKHLTK